MKQIQLKALLFATVYLLLTPSLAAKQPADSSIRFIVQHPLKTVEGHCQNVKISDLEYSLKDQLQLLSAFTITIHYRDLKTGNSNRDSHMMEVLGYPDHKSVIAKIDGLTPDGNRVRITGHLTIKGITRPFQTMASTARTEKGSLTISGSTTVLLSQFQIEKPSLLGMSIEDTVQIHYRFILDP
tara:strand:+ start:13294 stop:13845 length:552 start_codon:yes stop_codon:yes gene_type:complete